MQKHCDDRSTVYVTIHSLHFLYSKAALLDSTSRRPLRLRACASTERDTSFHKQANDLTQAGKIMSEVRCCGARWEQMPADTAARDVQLSRGALKCHRLHGDEKTCSRSESLQGTFHPVHRTHISKQYFSCPTSQVQPWYKHIFKLSCRLRRSGQIYLILCKKTKGWFIYITRSICLWC